MNTDQKYVGRGNSATPNPSAAPVAAQTSPTADNRLSMPFEPSFLLVPVHLLVHGRDGENYGTSQITVLIEALQTKKEVVSGCPKCADNDLTLELIDELIWTLLDVMFTRLSDSSEILHKQKRNLK